MEYIRSNVQPTWKIQSLLLREIREPLRPDAVNESVSPTDTEKENPGADAGQNCDNGAAR